MSLEQVRAFVVIADAGSIGRGAERLHISQPPLTRKLRALEDELGATLFVRTPRGVRLSPAGVRFMDHALRILDAVDDAERAFRGGSSALEPS
ncbi:MAG: LysR family transcriptional regulator [Myxococcota bacterium]